MSIFDGLSSDNLSEIWWGEDKVVEVWAGADLVWTSEAVEFLYEASRTDGSFTSVGTSWQVIHSFVCPTQEEVLGNFSVEWTRAWGDRNYGMRVTADGQEIAFREVRGAGGANEEHRLAIIGTISAGAWVSFEVRTSDPNAGDNRRVRNWSVFLASPKPIYYTASRTDGSFTPIGTSWQTIHSFVTDGNPRNISMDFSVEWSKAWGDRDYGMRILVNGAVVREFTRKGGGGNNEKHQLALFPGTQVPANSTISFQGFSSDPWAGDNRRYRNWSVSAFS